ncbi:MAG: metal ABC transporter permease [Patescibacteria group bacterium]|mgnify:FL=1
MDNTTLQLLTAVFISAAASLLGVFAILKRMSLVGDALSHVALPGIALAIFFKINPFIGVLLFLLVATVGIWLLEYKSSLSVDTLVGVFFTASLAIGSLFISEFELLEALFGDISKITFFDMVLSVALSIFLIVFLLVIHKKLALHMVSRDLASSIGINSKQLELVYLLLFALAVALGFKFVGALLMGALIIIPAAAAKNICRSLNGFMLTSVIFGVVSAIAGVYLSDFYGYPAGPVFILASVAIFIISLGWRAVFKK